MKRGGSRVGVSSFLRRPRFRSALALPSREPLLGSWCLLRVEGRRLVRLKRVCCLLCDWKPNWGWRESHGGEALSIAVFCDDAKEKEGPSSGLRCALSLSSSLASRVAFLAAPAATHPRRCAFPSPSLEFLDSKLQASFRQPLTALSAVEGALAASSQGSSFPSARAGLVSLSASLRSPCLSAVG